MKSYGWLLRDCHTFDFSELLITTFLLLAFQIALQFPYRFWDSKVQGADFFGHVPPSASKRGLFAVFYDMDPQVKSWVLERGLNSLVKSLEFGLVITPMSSPGANGHCGHSGCLYAGGALAGHVFL